MEFPRWMYREDAIKGRLFHSKAQLEEAGDGWFDSPAFLTAPDPEKDKPKRGRPRKVENASA